MYNPSNPAKYGLKILCLTDARTLSTAFIYCGKTTEKVDTLSMSIPTRTALTLAGLVLNTSRNITADNWYSLIELADELNRQSTTYVGTPEEQEIQKEQE